MFVSVLKGGVERFHLDFATPLQRAPERALDLHDLLLGAVEPEFDLAQRLAGARQFRVVDEAPALVCARRRLPRRRVPQTLDDRLQIRQTSGMEY